MASTSLGTLTLDLAVRLSEFTDGLTRAERQARDSASNISDSVSELRDNIADDISKISGSFAGMAIGSLAVAAGAMAAFAIETAKADVQLGIMAGTANTNLKSFQVLTHAAAGFGVEQEALTAILADTQEKLGEFSATGGGGAADFFEALQNNTKMTDEEIRNLGKTLQGKDGVEAIQLLKDKMDELGATSQEQRFMFESLAGDLGNLMPLFANGGVILEEYGVQLTDAGVIKTQEAIEQSRRLAAQTQAIQTQFEGLKTQLVAQMIPALSTLIDYFGEGSKQGRGFKNEVNGVGDAVRITTGLIIGLAASVNVIAQSFQAVGAQMRNIGQTYTAFVEADGVIAKSKALIGGTITSAGLMSVSMQSIGDSYDRAIRAFEASSAGQQKRLTGLAGTYYGSNTFLQSYNEGLEVSTKQADENAKAEDKRAKALDKTAKAQERLVGISGDTGIGSAHLHVQYRDKSRAVSAADLARFQVGGKNITDYRKTSGYGPRNTGIKGASTYHRGTDYGVPKNTPITTSVPVKNVKTWLDKKGGGYVSTITFGDGVVIDLLHQMPGIMGIEKGETTGNNQIDGAIKRADTMWQKSAADAARTQEKVAADALRAQEETLRKQASVAGKWAYEKEKIELDYQKNVAEVKEAHAEGSADYIKYMARVEDQYIKDRNAGVLSLSEKYFSEEQRIHAEHKKAMEVIEKTYIEDDNLRQYYVDAQKAAYKEDLDNFRWAAGAKARAQGLAANNLSDVINMSGGQAASAAEDLRAEQTMRPDLYQKWKLEKDYKTSQETVDQMYGSRKGEINALDLSTGDPVFDATQRNKLLQEAEQEHLNKMLLMEEEHSVKKKELDKQLGDARISMQEMAFSSMTSAASMFFGENSKMHKAAFAMEKAFAVQKALMNIEETYSNTFNAISAIPLIGPYIAMPMAIAASAMQIASAAGIQGMSAPSVSGIAHGGLDYVPKESTYLLDKGERVLSPRQNKDLANFMANGQKDNASGITINNNSSAQVSANRGPNGEVTVEMVDKMMDKRFRRIGKANSLESKSIQRGTTARPNRR